MDTIKNLPGAGPEPHKRTVKGNKADMVAPPAHPLDTSSAPLATAMGTKAGQAAKLKPSQPRRQSIDAQIKQLKHQIDLDLEYIQSLLRHGKNDKAIARMRWVTMRQDRILELVTQWQEYQATKATPSKPRETETIADPKLGKVTIGKHADKPRKAGESTLIKRKTYKRWADK
jgi:hypothetical protein